ncbi:MAG: hypothetical protein IJU48_00100 [Synergistaceae bacterium]|nr:hypothetical protein [Synergistaceae bacterium]
MGFFSKAKDTASAAWDCKKEIAAGIGSAAIGDDSLTTKATKAVVNTTTIISAYERGRKKGK